MEVSVQKCRAFVETARYGSFTKAAELLSYSQSGISRMVGELERECGVVLLDRDRAGVRLTSDGEELLGPMQKMCRMYDDLCMHIDQVRGIDTGLIRIGATSVLSTVWLPNIIGAFRADYPGIRYEVVQGDYGELETKVREGTLDCAFLRLPASGRFHEIPLESEGWVAVLPEGHPLAELDEVPPEELLEYPFILPERFGDKEENDVVSKAIERWGLTPNTIAAGWIDDAALAMVERGLGVSIMPEMCTRRKAFRIVMRPLAHARSRDVGVILKSLDAASVATRKFLEYLPYRNCDRFGVDAAANEAAAGGLAARAASDVRGGGE
ncbi:LysR family transcriptional regulator [Adlercreutzia sp. ZJ141]|uniref:LysR family transcriptional regulator n=1 Tax=Adlercreutzia sp. ZJ141 TaxID=2709406 RepID=UPI0013EDDDA1|nr:LysR family transcriptional regulator [Adlercreutzia sp. ZJ141]